jgi:hypothetical protein
MANKRKNHNDEESSSTGRAVVFSPHNASNSNSSEWTNHLNAVSTLLSHKESDVYLQELQMYQTVRSRTMEENLTNKLEQAAAVQRQIEHQIDQTQAKMQDESVAASMLNEELEKMHRHAAFVQQQGRALDERCRALAKETAELVAATEHENGCTELTKHERQLQVPRLQQQLSLYATMTGIKWDFDKQEELENSEEGGEAAYLIGSVVRVVLL